MQWPGRRSVQEWWRACKQRPYMRDGLLAPLEPMLHDSLLGIRIFAGAVLLFSPLYFAFWRWVEPQPVESLPFRLAAMAACLPLLFRRFRVWMGPVLSNWYWSFALWFALPYFFFTMYRANGYNDVWMGSTVAMLYCLYILTDWRLATLHAVSAAAAATAVQPVMGGLPHPPLAHLAIFFFTFGTSILLSLSDANMRVVRTRAAMGALGVMAHELRTPLASAGLLLDALKPRCEREGELATAQHAKLRETMESINAMIDFQIGSTKLGEFPKERVNVALADVARDAINTLPTATPSMRECIELVVLDQGRVRTNFHLLRQVIHNLLDNAVKAIQSQRPIEPEDITIAVYGDERWVRMIVADRGPGIPEEHRHRIFEPFFSTSDMPSHGLGLPMCRSAMTALGGEIWCTSSPQGANFQLALPRLAS